MIKIRCVSYPQQIKAIADSGAKVVVTGGKVGDLALHYCNKFGLLVVRLTSKWDLRRLCKAIRATPLPRIVSRPRAHAHRRVHMHSHTKTRALKIDGHAHTHT